MGLQQVKAKRQLLRQRRRSVKTAEVGQGNGARSRRRKLVKAAAVGQDGGRQTAGGGSNNKLKDTAFHSSVLVEIANITC